MMPYWIHDTACILVPVYIFAEPIITAFGLGSWISYYLDTFFSWEMEEEKFIFKFKRIEFY